MTCTHCASEAVLRIPANPDHVCLEHAIAFWTGFLAYAKSSKPADAVAPPLVARASRSKLRNRPPLAVPELALHA